MGCQQVGLEHVVQMPLHIEMIAHYEKRKVMVLVSMRGRREHERGSCVPPQQNANTVMVMGIQGRGYNDTTIGSMSSLNLSSGFNSVEDDNSKW
jgi:hypothetical protein